MVSVWVIIIGWAYLELLVITRTDKLQLVPSNYLFCGCMCLHSWVTSLKFHCFLFTRGENSANFRKFSQQMEYTRAKWTRYGGQMVKAKGEHNSELNLFITQTVFDGSLQFKLSKFHCIRLYRIKINLV